MNLKIYTNIKIYFLYFFSIKNRSFYKFILNNIYFSKSQIYQDLFVLFHSQIKKYGKFIEIGGGNGIELSNTYYLEKKKNWTGIICEPEISSHKKIKNIRSAKLETRPISDKCEYDKTFFINKDTYQSSLKKNKNYLKKIKINTICLNHLIEKNKFKGVIDYISIDTEGNELDILRKFNFKKYKVNFFTIEHNFNKKKRMEIFRIMKKNNFVRVYKYLSYMDDWYINQKIYSNE